MALLPDDIRLALSRAGACAAGFAPLGPVEPEALDAFGRWLEGGNNASMGYLASYPEIRRNPALLLDPPPAEGTVICAAFPYAASPGYRPGALRFARYALGEDYHEVLRRRLLPVARMIEESTGCKARVCVDTAPILERYWARRAGVGFIGLNRQLIVPGAGSYVLLAEIVTSLRLPPDEPCTLSCRGCGACLRTCPGGALGAGGLDARRCLSYLTIEHRGPLPEGLRLPPGRVYGCDLCQEVCPHNREISVSPLPEFLPRPEMLGLTREEALDMPREEFSRLMRGSAVKRAKAEGLRRNAGACGDGACG